MQGGERKEGRRKREKLKVFCIVKFLLLPFAPMLRLLLSGVTLNGMSGNDSRSELRGVLTKKMKEGGEGRNFHNQLW